MVGCTVNIKQFLSVFLFSVDECFPFEIPYSDKRLPAGCKNFIRARAATNDVNLQGMFIHCKLFSIDETCR